MKILFCVEFYYPSIGGAQTVIRKIAECLAKKGHEVYVATSCNPKRDFLKFNGVNVVEFEIGGNLANGMWGEIKKYQNYLVESDFDVIMFYAAQQWSFDASWEVLSKIKSKKFFVPCGYSSLHMREYASYYSELPNILLKMKACIYHAENYRDKTFAINHGARNDVLIPNGADLDEFNVGFDPSFRARYGIPEDFNILLTVGSVTGSKGHMELLRAFNLLVISNEKYALILNGNIPIQIDQKNIPFLVKVISYKNALFNLAKSQGIIHALFHLPGLVVGVLGLSNFYFNCIKKVIPEIYEPSTGGSSKLISHMLSEYNKKNPGKKKSILVDMPREDLVQAFLQAKAFIFASNIEYSPLVLFEAAAAGLPFLSAPVGNAGEIALWTGGGKVIRNAQNDFKGYTYVSPKKLSEEMQLFLADRIKLDILKAAGKKSVQEKFNWNKISDMYENLFFDRESA